jgi:hypothetical protein
MRKMKKPIGYHVNLPEKLGSKIFGKGCTVETHLLDDEQDELAPSYAVFCGDIANDKLQRIAAILNED